MLESEPVKAKDWIYTRVAHDEADELLNRAPLDGLLTIFHSGSKSGSLRPTQSKFLEALIFGRYVESNVAAMDRLTTALDRASASSSKIGWGLVAVGVGSVVLAVLTYLK